MFLSPIFLFKKLKKSVILTLKLIMTMRMMMMFITKLFGGDYEKIHFVFTLTVQNV